MKGLWSRVPAFWQGFLITAAYFVLVLSSGLAVFWGISPCDTAECRAERYFENSQKLDLEQDRFNKRLAELEAGQ